MDESGIKAGGYNLDGVVGVLVNEGVGERIWSKDN